MHFHSQKSVRRLIIILDTAATTAAFLIALYLRMWSKLVPWRVELYSTVYVLNILIYLFWNTYRRAKHHEYRITKMDPVENVARVFRERVFQRTRLKRFRAWCFCTREFWIFFLPVWSVCFSATGFSGRRKRRSGRFTT